MQVATHVAPIAVQLASQPSRLASVAVGGDLVHRPPGGAGRPQAGTCGVHRVTGTATVGTWTFWPLWRRQAGLLAGAGSGSSACPSGACAAGLASGALVRVGRGGYALPDAPPALVVAVSVQGVASHLSAAVLHGLAVWSEPVIADVIVPRGTRRSARGVRVHHADLAPADVDPDRAVTSLLRTLLDCGRTLPLAEAVVILDSAVRARVVTVAQLRSAAHVARGPGAGGLRRAVRHVDPLAGSPLESALRVLMSVLDVDMQSQVRIAGVGTVDFVLDGWLVVEGDGFEFHSDRASYRDDRRRSNGLAERGYVLLRFTWEDVRLRPHWVLARVERVLAQRPAADIPAQASAPDAH